AAAPQPTQQEAAPVEKTGFISIKAPAGAKVKLGKDYAKLEDGKLKLTGFTGAQFFVTIETPGAAALIQPVFMTDDGPLPPEIDTAKGVQVVQKPIPKKPGPGGAAPPGGPAVAATAAQPAGGGGGAAPPPPKEKPKPKVETTFE